MMKTIVLFFGFILLWINCDKNPAIDHDFMLDGDQILDASLYSPEDYLLSVAKPDPSADDLNTPVVLITHGYSATTFEWDEFRNWAADTSGFFISQILLGGHGRDYETFKNASWKDWQRAIVQEYDKLLELGYSNINLLSSSTSCALILDLFATGYFDHAAPQQVFFVDPIIIPSNKLLTLVGFIGPMLGYMETDPTEEEKGKWYHFRPQETLQELQKVLNRVRKQLEDGIRLSAPSLLHVYKSKKDPSADPVSAVLIYKGVRTANGHKVNMNMIDSELHVFTRLAGRAHISNKDKENQLKLFEEVKLKVR